MAANEASILGLEKTFRIHPNIKRYTLLDNGFTETSAGKYRWERQLGDAGNKQSPKLKITISNNFSKLKMSTLNANGLKELNLFQSKGYAEEIEMLEAELFQLIKENVLEEV